MNLLQSLEARDAKLLPWIREAVEAWGESLAVPSEDIAPEYRSEGKYTSLKAADKKFKKNSTVSQKKLDKQIRLQNIELYRQQLESGDIDYQVNEDKQYANQINFINVMININVIDGMQDDE